MKERYFIIGLIIVLLQSTACIVPRSNGIDKLWFFTYYNGSPAKSDSVLTPASFLDLRKDGTFTNDFGVFDYGAWKLKDSKLYLEGHHTKNSVLTVEYFAGNEMRISSADFPPASFESQPGLFKSPEENPFSAENNVWRIPAKNKESEATIKNRLLNHLKFWEAYFTWALNNGLQSIDVRSTPTPIKIYGNGFGLKPFSELPRTWKSYFFDEDDCKKANDMIKSIFDKHDIAWAHTENKYKLFISAFQQLEQQLR